MEIERSNIDRLLKARAKIDEQIRGHKTDLVILFTDIVGSTAYFDRYGDTAGVVMLHRHADLVSNTVRALGGTVIKTIGDSVMAEFPDATVAVRTAIEIQQRFAGLNHSLSDRERLQVRIGINAGRGFREGNDVYGDAVNVAARITKHSGPGQILVSGSVHGGLGGWTANYRSLGKVTIEGKAEKEDIFEVLWAGDAVPSQSAPAIQPETVQVGFAFAGRYRVLAEVGQGGMGIVYKTQDSETGEVVAVKVLRPAIALDESAVERFKNEVRLARKIAHRNVCRIYEFNRAGNTAFISMEFVEGETLRAILHRFRSLSLKQSIAIARQICSALHEAHALGIAHRDLKPENIMIDKAGDVKLMDFGIARFVQGGTTTTGIKGTPAYMSPEQAEGKTIDHRCDIYAFGLVLYEMLTGSAPFTGDTPLAVALQHVRDTPPAPSDKEPSVPPGIEQLIMRCLRKNPDDRYAAVADIEKTLESSADAAPSPAPPRAATSRRITALFGETYFVIEPARARLLFLLIQAGYLALYSAIVYHIESIERLLQQTGWSPWFAMPLVVIAAMCGIAVRIYTLSSVGFKHPEAGHKFMTIFPAVLVLDAAAAASPLLLSGKIGFGLALVFCAGLAYLPFSQTTLIQNAYRIRA